MGLPSVLNGRQALKFCFQTAVAIIIQIVDQLFFEIIDGIKLMLDLKLNFQQAKEVFHISTDGSGCDALTSLMVT